jgi:hypothetical protein
MTSKSTSREADIFIQEIDRGQMVFCVQGSSPLICNRMSEKAQRELLLPKGRKTAADRAASLKHDPLNEFFNSPYKSLDNNNPTRLQALSSMFKQAMMSAALDLPGAKKAQIGRLLYVEGDRVDLYGIPQLMMSVTRSSDMNRTPDVRTRAILREWACKVTVSFIKPIINETSVANLFSAAGLVAGIGDWRTQKGSGSYGQFRLVGSDEPDFLRIMKYGREAQDKALASPESYDDETESLLSWFQRESVNRGLKIAA